MIKYQPLREYILNQNVYNTETDDQRVKKKEVLATRFYLIVLMIILYAYSFYATAVTHTSTITITKPTIEQYKDLIQQYPDTLRCPCERISIPYEKFLHISPVYHQICSSDFISQRWIDYLFYNNSSYYFQLDFRRSALGQFQLLRLFCEQVQDTIDYDLIQFYSNQLITQELLPMETFDIQTDSLINFFQRTTPPSFLDVFNLNRLVLTRQHFLSGTGALLNAFWRVSGDQTSTDLYVTIYYEVGNAYFSCICMTPFICTLPEGIYANMDRYDVAGNSAEGDTTRDWKTWHINATFLLPGMRTGCVPSESLFHSTTECLYDDSCLTSIGTHINYTSTKISSFSKLNQSLSTVNTTYETLVNSLFIQKWITNRSFDDYFDECQPLYCQYTNEVGESWSVIVTSTISLYGGLRIVLSPIILFLAGFVLKNCQHRQTNTDNNSSNLSIETCCSQSIRSIWDFFKKYNLFNSSSSDERSKRNQILSTRIYCVLLPILLTIFGVYLLLEKQTKLITIKNPTQNQFEQLENISVNNLFCPCSDISIKYDTFLSLQPRYHPICSSVFSSTLWLKNWYWSDTSNYNSDNFRFVSDFFFEFLVILCEAANELVTTSLTTFKQNEYLTSEVVSSDIFKSEVTSFIELFTITTQQAFQLRINLIRRILSANQFLNQRKTNTILSVINYNNNTESHAMILSVQGCSCATNPSCKQPLTIYDDNRTYRLMGIYQGCLFIDSVLLSTTECFFSNYCINTLKSFMLTAHPLHKLLKALNSSILSSYQPNTTMDIIVNNLFIEDWNALYFYNQYYNQCQPSYCSYTKEENENRFDVLTKLIAIYGGLSMILKICVPILVNVIKRKKGERGEVSFTSRIRQGFLTIKAKLINFNLFRTQAANNPTIERQLYTTRFYLIISIITFASLLFYTLINEKLITVKVQLNNLDEYNNLRNKYSATLSCPCSDISVTYSRFIKLNPSYHQICSSDFVTQQWIEYLYNENRTYEKSFYAVASVQFQVLSSLCKQAQETVNNSLVQFQATKFTSDQLISPELFQIQIDTILSSFKKSAPQTFKQALTVLSGFIHGNAFITPYETNWKFTVVNIYDLAPMYTNPRWYGESCNCATSSKCTERVQLNENVNSTLTGMLIGCYVHEALLQWTLECLYKRECVNLIINSFRKQIPAGDDDVQILNSSLLTNAFPMTETVQDMVDRLFVNEWNVNYSYEKYYEQCHSASCTYSFTQYFDIFYIVTTIVGLFGSLTILLRMLSKLIIFIALSIINRQQNRAVEVSSSTG
ncbi:unnamed protein product [Adineta ricciae]|uniref:Uncharacterized protein n=1 Tax=Adineta ricciae TaxID=249248 RepID=A0A815VU46_ADIRI|nr:unnamed protein product [Adineta ricciae]CAF1534740.1 unnamed protein product [Adineta ricciae]